MLSVDPPTTSATFRWLPWQNISLEFYSQGQHLLARHLLNQDELGWSPLFLPPSPNSELFVRLASNPNKTASCLTLHSGLTIPAMKTLSRLEKQKLAYNFCSAYAKTLANAFFNVRNFGLVNADEFSSLPSKTSLLNKTDEEIVSLQAHLFDEYWRIKVDRVDNAHRMFNQTNKDVSEDPILAKLRTLLNGDDDTDTEEFEATPYNTYSSWAPHGIQRMFVDINQEKRRAATVLASSDAILLQRKQDLRILFRVNRDEAPPQRPARVEDEKYEYPFASV